MIEKDVICESLEKDNSTEPRKDTTKRNEMHVENIE